MEDGMLFILAEMHRAVGKRQVHEDEGTWKKQRRLHLIEHANEVTWKKQRRLDWIPPNAHSCMRAHFIRDRNSCEGRKMRCLHQVRDFNFTIIELIEHIFKPDFKPSEAIKVTTVVWMRLPELPIEYYDG
ncbi:hypothetical protein LguiA_002383 [Lonicera macranthoides]